jgi:hypothetical protein
MRNIPEPLDMINFSTDGCPELPHADIVVATKELVDCLLSMNTSNRPIRKSAVTKYANEIKAGRWILTNQGIGVSDDGVLIDGQHRLEALKQCGYPEVEILLVINLPASSAMAVDQHAKRSARDMIKFAFDARVNRLAPAIATSLMTSVMNKRSPHSMHDIYDCITNYMVEIEQVTSIPKSSTFFAAPHLAAFVHCISDGIGTIEQLRKFISDVESGELLTKQDPQLHLRNFIITTRKSSAGELLRLERFAKSKKAFTAYAKGEQMGVLRA